MGGVAKGASFRLIKLMRIRYRIQLKDPIVFEDHWPIPMLGGELQPISKNGLVVAFDFTLSGQPVDQAPTVTQHDAGNVKATITMKDNSYPFVMQRMETAFTFIQAYFDAEILMDEVEFFYDAETCDEQDKIAVSSLKRQKASNYIQLGYDVFTRALKAGECNRAPEFEVTLIRAARAAFTHEKYIDSFRYAFLLIESVYGQGKFKTTQLVKALNESASLRSMVERAIQEHKGRIQNDTSDTAQLLQKNPTASELIEHMVKKRGFYFHGNRQRQGAWQPHRQESAKQLCLLTIDVALEIAHEAASAMFDDSLSRQHFDDAQRVGAVLKMRIKFKFQEPRIDFVRSQEMRITTPGTRVTPKVAAYVLKEFLHRFEELAPLADLKAAVASLEESGQPVFELTLHGEPSSKGSDQPEQP
jgi:hypothetical protein